MMDEDETKSTEIEDWIRELLPDVSADFGIGRAATLPSSSDLSNYNNQQIKPFVAMALNNNPSMWQQHPQSDNLNNSVNQRTEISKPALFQELPQNQTTSNMVSNFRHPQLLQNQVERPNIFQFPMQSNSYPSNSMQHRPVQAQLGSLHMSAIHRAQNVTLADQMKPGNQAQTMPFGPLQASTPPELTAVNWVDQAYYKILQMKEKFSPELLTFYKRSQETRQSLNDPETLNKCEKIRIIMERIFNFLSMSRSDITRWRRDKLYQFMNEIVKYANQVRVSNSLAQKQNQQQVEPNINAASVGNIFQLNSSQPSFSQSNARQISPMRPIILSNQTDTQQTEFDQRALRMLLNPTNQLNNAAVTSPNNVSGQSAQISATTNVTPALQSKQQNDQAIKRQKNTQQIVQRKGDDHRNTGRFAGLERRKSPLSANSPQNSQQSSSRIEPKDLSSSPSSSSKISKSATVSVSASSPAFPSPLTPLTPCSKPADFAKSPLSIDESSKFPQNCADPPLQDASQNLIVADGQGAVSCGGDTESAEKQSPRVEEDDSVKRLVAAVTSMSPRALNSAIQDIDAVTSLTDRIATNLLHGGSTKVVFQDLADDISKFRVQSTMEDQRETTTLNQMTNVMGFRGSDIACANERPTEEPSDLLLQEIKEINQRFMEVKVDVVNLNGASRIGSDEGALIRCSYIPVGPASQQMIYKVNLELIVPVDYPKVSPTVSEKMPPGCSDFEEGKNMWDKAKSNFGRKLRIFSQPITIKQMARAWEDSAREVFIERAEQMGGGSSFSSRCCGKWESFTTGAC